MSRREALQSLSYSVAVSIDIDVIGPVRGNAITQSTVFCVSACVLSLLLGVDAWSCSVTLIGDTEQQQSVAFSTAAIHCTPGVDERGQDLLVVPWLLTVRCRPSSTQASMPQLLS